MDETARTVYLTSFVGTAVGYFVMVIVAAVLIGLVVGGGGDGAAASSGSGNLFGILDLVIPLVVLAIPVGLTGVGASFLARRPTIREPPAR